jgi:hypothetical protein
MTLRNVLHVGAVVMSLIAAGSAPALAQSTCPFTATGSLDPTDPDQNGRLFRDDPGGACGAPQPCALFDATPRDFDMYTFATPAGPNPACVTVTITNNCGGTSSLQSVAYTTFDPTNLCANYIADIGATPNPTFNKAYSFDVPPSSTFVVTVNDAGLVPCPSYQIDVTGCDVVPVELIDIDIR